MRGQAELSFHNTIELESGALEQADSGAKSFETRVLEILQISPEGITLMELKERIEGYAPTSYCRALSNLADRNKYPTSGIVKTSERRQGRYKAPNSVYKHTKFLTQ